MKAVVASDYSGIDALAYQDWPEPEPKPGQVLIRAEAIGANFADGLMVQGRYQVKPEPPFVPGMEVAGVVEAVGEGVTAFKAGDRVAAFSGLGCFAEKVETWVTDPWGGRWEWYVKQADHDDQLQNVVVAHADTAGSTGGTGGCCS